MREGAGLHELRRGATGREGSERRMTLDASGAHEPSRTEPFGTTQTDTITTKNHGARPLCTAPALCHRTTGVNHDDPCRHEALWSRMETVLMMRKK